ncbi:repetitive organellar protein-like [Drosophila takahashii]|uniref:repetitive organellar protein-like n=1 Tax=Drosophila takahashii TaxID=29030 RepID=UPI001CF87ABD|nr:uncharacterized protein LOC108069453 [Drosophila takahashii]
MHYLIVLILFGVYWNNVYARGLDQSESYDTEQRLDTLEDRVLRLETEMGVHQDEETLNRIDLEPSFYSIDTSNTKVGRPVETNHFNEQLEKLEQTFKEEFGDQLAELSSKYEILWEKFSKIEKQVEEQQSEGKNSEFLKGLEQSENPTTTDSEESETKSDETIYDNDLELMKNLKNLENESGTKMAKNFKQIGEKYYHIENNVKLTWVEARDKCSEWGAHLVSLKNEEEWGVITEHLSPEKNYWVDVNDLVKEGEYISDTNSEKAAFLKWDYREPNNLLTTVMREDCVELRSDYYHYMNDINCWQENNFICERPKLSIFDGYFEIA